MGRGRGILVRARIYVSVSRAKSEWRKDKGNVHLPDKKALNQALSGYLNLLQAHLIQISYSINYGEGNANCKKLAARLRELNNKADADMK